MKIQSEGSDAYIENVEMPEYLYPGDSYSMTVTVESNYETDAKLQLCRERRWSVRQACI